MTAEERFIFTHDDGSMETEVVVAPVRAVVVTQADSAQLEPQSGSEPVTLYLQGRGLRWLIQTLQQAEAPMAEVSTTTTTTT